MKEITERNAYVSMYEDYSLEQLIARLRLADEQLYRTEQAFKSETLRHEVIKELINKERDRIGAYYSQLGGE